MERPFWYSAKPPAYEKLNKPGKYDVVVIGGGIMGVTTAYLLSREGQRVALLERERFGTQDTGHTTAHVTHVTDLALVDLVKSFGKSHAQAVRDANQAGMIQLEEIVEAEEIACDFTHLPGFWHASLVGKTDERRKLRKEADVANELGFDATYLDVVPYVNKPGVRFANQAKFHPLKYLSRLLEIIKERGVDVYQDSEVKEFRDKPLGVKANGHWLDCGYVVIATHVPLMGNTDVANATLFQTKLYPYSSYVIGAKIPKGRVPEALFWDTTEPYYYLRVESFAKHDYAIFGGEDHKTGTVSKTESRYAKLAKVLHKLITGAKIDSRWSGQVIETNDGIPYIGHTADKQFVGTGFAGNGTTFGTLAAMMAFDAIMGRKNPWVDLFSPSRKKLRGGTWDYLRENTAYPYYMVKDRLAKAEGKSLSSVGKGEGKILLLDGQRAAVCRDASGKVCTLSPYCTHMGCIVHWNHAERTWDCPCHGSRFHPTGENLGGPAETPLPPLETSKKPAAKEKSDNGKPRKSKASPRRAKTKA